MRDTHVSFAPRSALVLKVALTVAIGGLAGCRTASPPADRIVYEVREMPYVLAYESAPTGSPQVYRDGASEAQHRAWVTDNYGRPARVVERSADDRYIPQVERVRERAVVVERAPSSRVWLPPLAVGLGLGYLAGHGWGGHHRDHWGWGVSWGYPLGCW
ncbi:MAG: hypothetical protein K8T90_17320 [Planctomycetes bacterium]|nr:hypothetical protein [Planctomycetota bacterium]